MPMGKMTKYVPPNKSRRSRRLTRLQRKQVKTLINRSEELYYYSAVSTGTSSSTFGVADLFAPAQDDTDSGRGGDRCRLAGSMEFRMQCTSVSTDSYNFIRVIIFQWKPNSVPTAANLLLNGPSGSVDINSLYSHDNRQMYHVLKDITFKVVYNSSDIPSVIKSFKIPLKKIAHNVQFSGGTTGGTNKIYVCIGSDSGSASHPAFTYNSKIFYYDA